MTLSASSTGMRSEISPWASCAQKLASWAMHHLVHRTDTWVIYPPLYRRVGDNTAVVLRGALNGELLEHHFEDRDHDHLIGLHCADNEGGCKWFVIEVGGSDESRSIDPAAACKAAIWLYRSILSRGLQPILMDSDGCGTYQLWVLLSQPLEVQKVATYAQGLVDELGDGLASVNALTYPRSTSPEGGDWGSWVRVPGHHHVRAHWSVLFDGERWVNGLMAIDLLLSTPANDGQIILTGQVPEEQAEPEGETGLSNMEHGDPQAGQWVEQSSDDRIDALAEALGAAEAQAGDADDTWTIPEVTDAVDGDPNESWPNDQAVDANESYVNHTSDSWPTEEVIRECVGIDSSQGGEITQGTGPGEQTDHYVNGGHVDVDEIQGVSEDSVVCVEGPKNETGKKISNETGGRAEAYLSNLPRGLRPGQGRSTMVFRIASFLIHELGLEKDEAKRRIHEWNVANAPPMTSQEISEIVHNISQIGKEQRVQVSEVDGHQVAEAVEGVIENEHEVLLRLINQLQDHADQAEDRQLLMGMAALSDRFGSRLHRALIERLNALKIQGGRVTGEMLLNGLGGDVGERILSQLNSVGTGVARVQQAQAEAEDEVVDQACNGVQEGDISSDPKAEPVAVQDVVKDEQAAREHSNIEPEKSDFDDEFHGEVRSQIGRLSDYARSLGSQSDIIKIGYGFDDRSGEYTEGKASGSGELVAMLGGGLYPGEAVLLAGESGFDQTAFAVQLCDSIAARNHEMMAEGNAVAPVVYLSISDGGYGLYLKSIARLSGIPIGRLYSRGYLTDERERGLVQAAQGFYRDTIAPYVTVVDREHLQGQTDWVTWITTQVNRVKHAFNSQCAVVVIDPVMLLRELADNDVKDVDVQLYAMSQREKVGLVLLAGDNGVESGELTEPGGGGIRSLVSVRLDLSMIDEGNDTIAEVRSVSNRYGIRGGVRMSYEGSTAFYRLNQS